MYSIFPGIGTDIVNSICNGRIDTGYIFRVDYTAISSHCNCTILPRYNEILKFASNTIEENCYTEITIHDLQQPELISTLIPCKGERQTPAFKVTQDSLFYMTSRSVNTTTAPQRFLQNIKIFGSMQFQKLILKHMYFILHEHYQKSTKRERIVSNLIFLIYMQFEFLFIYVLMLILIDRYLGFLNNL